MKKKRLETPPYFFPFFFKLSLGLVSVRTKEGQNQFAEDDNERTDIFGCTFERIIKCNSTGTAEPLIRRQLSDKCLLCFKQLRRLGCVFNKDILVLLSVTRFLNCVCMSRGYEVTRVCKRVRS